MSFSRALQRPEISRGRSFLDREKNSLDSAHSWGNTSGRTTKECDLCSTCMGVDQSGFESGVGLLSSRRQPFSAHRRGVANKWIFDPQSKAMRRWNRYFLLSSALGTALDPLFLSVFSIDARLSCLYVQKGILIGLTTMRALVDCAYVTQIWLQLRTAYVSKESLVLGRGELVWDARKIAANYITALSGIIFDIFIILPVPQVMTWVVIPRLIAKGGDTTKAMTFILISFLVQYLPKLVHSALLVRRLQRVTGYVFGTAASGFFLNLITYFICAHVAGSFWYLLTVQRVEACLGVQCKFVAHCKSTTFGCPVPISYHNQATDPIRLAWAQNKTVQGCLSGNAGDFPFGIYEDGVPLVTDGRFIQKILYPLFWGFMTFSSFGNALAPSDHIYEVLFSIIVVTCGLLLFTLLIGNIQVYLQSITAKKSQMQLRIRDLEWWMRRRQLPPSLRLRVRHQERHRWAAARGIDEEALVEDLPEGLRRDIKRHLCLDLLRKIPLFQHFDDLILNNICDRLKPLLFSKGESIIYEGNPIRQMLFIVRGNIRSEYRLYNNHTSSCVLSPGDYFGDELLSWGLQKSGGRLPSSSATLTTLEMTEAFSLRASDLKYITDHFRDRVYSDEVMRITRYYSTTWRMWAVVIIQLAWRRYKHQKIK
ncbi:hypothetical protein KC19_7G166200 [Ceratodon purpureus]|uniref:Cyclic nucleotide-binding domain-containing protein n=1 Tax=Ceratodon purpureus TaxID=3225 RepID=A0A8T0HB06_CERPU|nr:hypothetical protein KC19_7G166200 [Ceratodon purpureus]